MLKPVDFDRTLILTSPHYYALLVTISKDNKVNVMGLSWFMFTSFSPLLIAISVGNTRHTYKNLKEIPEFSLCFPKPEIAEKAIQCGMFSGKYMDKLSELKLETIKSEKITPPVIKESIVAYECEVMDSFATGDHSIFIGKIKNCLGDIDAYEHIYVKDGYSTTVSIRYDIK